MKFRLLATLSLSVALTGCLEQGIILNKPPSNASVSQASASLGQQATLSSNQKDISDTILAVSRAELTPAEAAENIKAAINKINASSSNAKADIDVAIASQINTLSDVRSLGQILEQLNGGSSVSSFKTQQSSDPNSNCDSQKDTIYTLPPTPLDGKGV